MRLVTEARRHSVIRSRSLWLKSAGVAVTGRKSEMTLGAG